MQRVVFLSATGRDLAEYRQAVIDHLAKLDHFLCDAQENFGARYRCKNVIAGPDPAIQSGVPSVRGDGRDVRGMGPRIRSGDDGLGLVGHGFIGRSSFFLYT